MGGGEGGVMHCPECKPEIGEDMEGNVTAEMPQLKHHGGTLFTGPIYVCEGCGTYYNINIIRRDDKQPGVNR